MLRGEGYSKYLVAMLVSLVGKSIDTSTGTGIKPGVGVLGGFCHT